MMRVLLAAAFVLLVAPGARADLPQIPPPNQPSPSSPPPSQPAPEPPPTKPKPDVSTTGCGLGLTAGIVLAGVWVLRSRRRLLPQG